MKRKDFKKIFRLFSKKERFVFTIFLSLFIISSLIISISFYLGHTKIIAKSGGSFKEGVVGRPRFVNPIYSLVNDPDQDLVELLFSGLMKYTPDGKIVEDLASHYDIEDSGRTYIFYLKDNAYWSDKKKITADDVVFTINTIQNPDYKSPLRAQWLGVKVTKLSQNSVRFSLEKPYSAFLENATIKIIPKHIFSNIPPESFPLTAFNLQPVTSGPYKFKDIKLDKLGFINSYTIARSENYFGQKPYISEITFLFFKNDDDLLNAAASGKIDTFSLSNAKKLHKSENKLTNFKKYEVSMPRYFALFLNPEKSKLLSDQDIREALNYATDKKEIVAKVLLGNGNLINSPLLPQFFGLSPPDNTYETDVEKAKEIFRKKGFNKENSNGFLEKTTTENSTFTIKRDLNVKSEGEDVRKLQQCLAKYPSIYPEGDVTGYFGSKTKNAVIRFQEKYKDEVLKPLGLSKGTGKVGPLTRKKINEICFPGKEETITLSFNLLTVDDPQMASIADLIKEQWKKAGIDLKIQVVPLSTLERDYIKDRNYEILLFGELSGLIPDPFPFWHSSQKKYPGLNLSLYNSKKADSLIEEIRRTSDENERKNLYEKLQNIIIEDTPAVFLYSPSYLYFTDKKIKGVSLKKIRDGSERFCNIENWYIKTKRSLKK